MEFADGACYLCGAEFGDKKPAKVTRVKPYEADKRTVEFVGPCPSCGKDVPLWAGTGEVPVAATEPEPAAEPTEPVEPTEPTVPPEPEA